MDSRKFARNMAATEEHYADQQAADDAESRRRAEDERFLLSNAGKAAQALTPLAREFVAAVNSELKRDAFVVFDGGGLCLKLGPHTAGFVYSQPYGNVGPMVLSVSIQQQSSNFGIPEFDRQVRSERRMTFRPVARSGEVWWADGSDDTVTGAELVQHVMRTLMRSAKAS